MEDELGLFFYFLVQRSIRFLTCERLSWRAGLPPSGDVFFGGGGGGLAAGGCPCGIGGAEREGAEVRSFSCICWGMGLLPWEYRSRIWWQMSGGQDTFRRRKKKGGKTYFNWKKKIIFYDEHLRVAPLGHLGRTAPTSGVTTAWPSTPGCQTYTGGPPSTSLPPLWFLAPTAGTAWCTGCRKQQNTTKLRQEYTSRNEDLGAWKILFFLSIMQKMIVYMWAAI